jgi:hypothetical protein
MEIDIADNRPLYVCETTKRRNPEGELQLVQSRNDIMFPELANGEGICVTSKSVRVTLASSNDE